MVRFTIREMFLLVVIVAFGLDAIKKESERRSLQGLPELTQKEAQAIYEKYMRADGTVP